MSGSECGVRCLRTSTVSSENDREYIHGWNEASTEHANEKEGYSTGERTTGSTEDGERLWRTSTKGQERLARRGSGEAIITKKRFVPEKFLPCACSYECRLNSCVFMHVLYIR